ncbi:MAG: type 4a pilus biogenesis protein PilO [Elusimicrobia bacterium]|nr:type 4a pilus biogenesis protein PilO [Elusimicrobiota bacterium]
MTKRIIQNIILMLLICGGLSYVFFRFMILPLNTKYAAAKENLIKAETKVAEMKQRAVELPRLEADMKLLQQRVSDLEKLLPREKEIPQLLRTITRTAQKYQIKVNQITPQPIVPLQNYSEIPFQFTVQGSYHAIALFLTDMGQGPRVMSARNIVFSPAPSVKGSPVTINATFVLVTYTFKG